MIIYDFFICEIDSNGVVVDPAPRAPMSHRRIGEHWTQYSYRGPTSTVGYGSHESAHGRARELLACYQLLDGRTLAVGRRRAKGKGRWHVLPELERVERVDESAENNAERVALELRELHTERDALRVECDELRVECDELRVERDELRAERDAALGVMA